ncbi:MAG: hypothetical protein QM796_08265 [Chthoniobacteraceae bacterium]
MNISLQTTWKPLLACGLVMIGGILLSFQQSPDAPRPAAPLPTPISAQNSTPPPARSPAQAPHLASAPATTPATKPAPTVSQPAAPAKQTADNDLTQKQRTFMARTALSGVGSDPVAENMWVQAINDPTFSKHDRQDLIEDLNEVGYADLKHPTSYDLNLMEYRLNLVEKLLPTAIDQVNYNAFQEAHRDLVNMLTKAGKY